MWMLLAFAAVVLLGAAPIEASGALSGRRAPGFALPDENMKYHDLADHHGKVVLLEIMLTRCPNCQKLARTIEDLKSKYGERIAVLAVVSPPDNRASVVDFKKTHKISSPILFDCGQMVGSYLLPDSQHPRIHVPHLFLIDGDGVIRNDFDHTSESIFEGKGLAAEIDRLLRRPE